MVSRQRSSQVDRLRDSIRREKFGHIIDGEAEQAGHTAHGDIARFDGQSDDLDESS